MAWVSSAAEMPISMDILREIREGKCGGAGEPPFSLFLFLPNLILNFPSGVSWLLTICQSFLGETRASLIISGSSVTMCSSGVLGGCFLGGCCCLGVRGTGWGALAALGEGVKASWRLTSSIPNLMVSGDTINCQSKKI